MIRYLFIAFLLGPVMVRAQDSVVSNSFYRHIRVLDDRPDTTRGATSAAYQQYFNALMDDVTDSTAGPGELTLQIRNFHSYGDMHRGGVWMRMVLYARATDGDERYSVLDVLDTVVETTTNVFKGSLHNRVVSATDETLTRFIRANLRRGLANAARWYGPGDLHDVENLTKSDLFVFTADTLKNGVYLSYSSFASQQPDGVMWEYNPRSTFAIVRNRQAFIFLDADPMPLVRRGNDFFYIGRVRLYSPISTEVASISALAALAATGGHFTMMVWGAWRKKDVWMRLDALSGRFVATREVKRGEGP